MKKLLLIAFFTITCSFYTGVFAQPVGNLWQDTLWSASGSHDIEQYGFAGLSYLGKMNTDSGIAQNALTIGESGGTSWIENKTRLDTTTQYFSTGQRVIRCNLSGTGRGDYVCYSTGNSFSFMVLYATDTPFVFDTVVTRRFSGQIAFPYVADFDLSGNESLILFTSIQTSGPDSSQALWYHGGTTFDTTPHVYYYNRNNIGGYSSIGNIRDKNRQFLCSVKELNATSARIYFNPLGATFSFLPSDSITVTTNNQGNFSGALLLNDVDDDSIQDILIGWGRQVLIYKGGESISFKPTYYFDATPKNVDPLNDFIPEGIYDIGNVVSASYRSILVTTPTYGEDLYSEPGAIFLFNIGKALKDSCVAYAVEGIGSQAELGAQAIDIGKYSGDTLDNYLVSGLYQTDDGKGKIIAFKGNSSYGTKVGVHEGIIIPTMFDLSQNYPNPCSGNTTITFSVLSPELLEHSLTLKLYDYLGKEIETLYSGKADGYGYTIGVTTAGLPDGTYFYRLECGGRSATKMLSLIK